MQPQSGQAPEEAEAERKHDRIARDLAHGPQHQERRALGRLPLGPCHLQRAAKPKQRRVDRQDQCHRAGGLASQSRQGQGKAEHHDVAVDRANREHHAVGPGLPKNG